MGWCQSKRSNASCGDAKTTRGQSVTVSFPAPCHAGRAATGGEAVAHPASLLGRHPLHLLIHHGMAWRCSVGAFCILRPGKSPRMPNVRCCCGRRLQGDGSVIPCMPLKSPLTSVTCALFMAGLTSPCTSSMPRRRPTDCGVEGRFAFGQRAPAARDHDRHGRDQPERAGTGMISTATALTRPNTQRGSGPKIPHARKVSAAMATTPVTK